MKHTHHAYLRVALLVALSCLLVLALAACKTEDKSGSGDKATGKKTTLTVGASPVPHAEILEQVKGDLAKQNITLKIVEYTDYVTPNTALNDGDIDANFFQHVPYLNDYNKQHKTNLVSVGAIHFEPLGIYAGKTKTIAALPHGAQIAVPNDTTNEARALLLLQDNGIIKLKQGAGIDATPKDIADNPKDVKIIEAEAAGIPRMLPDVDLAVINGNFALSAGVDSKTMITAEKADSLAAKTYANVIVVKKGHENDPAIKALVKALQSEKIRTFIETKYKGAVIPVF